jgi:hypothetical protein
MRITTGQIAQMVLQTLGSGKAIGNELELKIGSVVRATLLEYLKNGDVWLQIGDGKMRARLEAELKPGDQVDLLVTGQQKGGALELKLIGHAAPNQERGTLPLPNLSALLKALGMPEQEETKALVQEWMSRRLPLQEGTLKAALQVLQERGGVKSTDVATLGKMAELGIPISAATFEAMDTLDHGPRLHELLSRIQNRLQDVLKGSPFPENQNSRPETTAGEQVALGHAFSEQTRKGLSDLARSIAHLLQETDGGADDLAAAVRKLGLEFEDKLAHALRRLGGDRDANALRSALQAALAFDPDEGPPLKQALLQAQASLPELQQAGAQELAGELRTLLQHVTGQQLMQTPQVRTDHFYQFAAVPLQINGQLQTVELHVMARKGPGQKKLDSANCYILFHLEMPNLGELDIHLHIVNRVVGVRFQTDAPDRLAISTDDLKGLRDKLQMVGYHLGALKVEEKKQEREGGTSPLLPPILTQGKLDLRA